MYRARRWFDMPRFVRGADFVFFFCFLLWAFVSSISCRASVSYSFRQGQIHWHLGGPCRPDTLAPRRSEKARYTGTVEVREDQIHWHLGGQRRPGTLAPWRSVKAGYTGTVKVCEGAPMQERGYFMLCTDFANT